MNSSANIETSEDNNLVQSLEFSPDFNPEKFDEDLALLRVKLDQRRQVFHDTSNIRSQLDFESYNQKPKQ